MGHRRSGLGRGTQPDRPPIAHGRCRRSPASVEVLVALGLVVGRRRREIRLVEPEDVERVDIVDTPPRSPHRIADPARFACPLALVDIELAATGIGEDHPDDARADDEADDQQPPVEGVVHGARVQGSPPGPRQSTPTLLR